MRLDYPPLFFTLGLVAFAQKDAKLCPKLDIPPRRCAGRIESENVNNFYQERFGDNNFLHCDRETG